jgi:hypothetical protein
MNTVVPDEFRNACRNLGPNIEDIVSSVDDLAGIALIGVDTKDATVIRAFIDSIVSANPSSDELKTLWLSTPATLFFHDGADVLTMLKAIRDKLKKSPYFTD